MATPLWEDKPFYSVKVWTKEDRAKLMAALIKLELEQKEEERHLEEGKKKKEHKKKKNVRFADDEKTKDAEDELNRWQKYWGRSCASQAVGV